MKTICTTSNAYLHLIPVFTYLFNKYWPNTECEIVGYTSPEDAEPLPGCRPFKMPPNFTFHSMGTQGGVKEWSTDLRKYFQTQPDNFIWLMEDTLLRKVDMKRIPETMPDGVGKICLTNDVSKRDHVKMLSTDFYLRAAGNSHYRLSTQPSIWNKAYLLQYLTPGLNPWEFETQDPMNDGWHVYGMAEPVIIHNEGVRRFDPFKLDLTDMVQADVVHIKNIATWLK